MRGEMGGIGMGGGLEVGAMDCEMFVSGNRRRKEGKGRDEELTRFGFGFELVWRAVLNVWNVGGEGDVVR